MDPDTLRLILVLLGVALVAGIYLWDRYKRAAPPVMKQRRAPAVGSFDTAAEPKSSVARKEPRLDRESESDVVAIDAVAEKIAGDSIDPDPREPTSAALDPEPADIGDWGESVAADEPQMAMDLNFDAHGDNDYLSTDPALRDDVERKLIVINLAARNDGIAGPAIEKACSALHLALGDMSIFHRHDGSNGKVLFSVASMVEPGSFPAGDMNGFSTPGLTLFTQLPGARDGVEIYDQMLVTAKRLAELLEAECQDERHNKLTRQMEEHMRESIIEHRRKIRLARSRH